MHRIRGPFISALATAALFLHCDAAGPACDAWDPECAAGLLLYSGQLTTDAGRFLYVGNPATAQIQIFRIDAASGALTETSDSPVSAVGTSVDLFAAPAAGRLMSADDSAATLWIHQMNSESGALSLAAGSPLAASGSTPVSVHATRDGRLAYLALSTTGSAEGFIENPATGIYSFTPVYSGSDTRDLCLSPDAAYAIVTQNGSGATDLVSVNQSTGELSFLMQDTSTVNALRCASDPLGRFFFVTSGSGAIDLFVLDRNAQTIAPAAGSPYFAGPAPERLALNADASRVYVHDTTNLNIAGFALDRTAQTLTPLSGSPFLSNVIEDLDVDPSGKWIYFISGGGSSVSTGRIDPQTGAITEVVATAPVVAGAATLVVVGRLGR